jgi:outer membrane receptor protein involved in Fe transport
MRAVFGSGLALLALVALGARPAQAQTGKLTGLVTDAATGEPLAGAQVTVEGTGRSVLTQDNGRYFLINIPPGVYTVSAQLIGYATVRKENVQVSIDVTRTVDFALPSEALAVAAVVVEAERVPLIETRATGASNVITAEQIQALPVNDLQGVLALQHGFLEVPQNTDVISYDEQRRGLSPVRIRGGRQGETLTLVDGIPINNFVFGGPAMFLPSKAVEQVDYLRGGFEAQYGNALSGVINIATREGGEELEGAIEYQTSAVGGALGSEYDEMREWEQLDGFVSGPVPLTSNKLRFMAAAQFEAGVGRVLKFDDLVYNPYASERDLANRYASIYDLFPGYRQLGFDSRRDLYGKLTYYFTPAAKLSFLGLDYQRQTQPYMFSWLRSGFDMFGRCTELYPDSEDICRTVFLNGVDPQVIADLQATNQEQQYVLQSSINQNRQLWVLKWDHTLSRTAYTAAIGRFDQNRTTCTFVSGVCIEDRMAYTYWAGPFHTTGSSRAYGRQPFFGTDKIYGGEELKTWVGRFDLQTQLGDHHNIKAGVFFQRHDVAFEEFQQVGLNNVALDISRYAAKPWDAAAYVQDNIEFDFLRVNLGFRFDYGRADGLFWANPRDPTNGTTLYHVCENPTAFGLPADKFQYVDPNTGGVYTGVQACGLDRALFDEANEIALKDDFKEAPVRKQWSPRLGVSVPVTENSSFFFNFGRYSQNPLLHNMYRGTGIGTPLEGTPQAARFFHETGSILIGNPQLVTEQTSSYEFGFLSELFGNYALSAVLFNKDQLGLTGIRRGGVTEVGTPVFDPGANYNNSSTPSYTVLLNLDYQTVRGLEVSLARRLGGYWGFDLRYSLSQMRTNAAPPDLEMLKQAQNDPPAYQEIRSEIDQAHVFNGVLRFAVGDDAPDIPLGNLLRNASASITLRAASGLPYTPELAYAVGDAQRNSGTSPATFDVNLLVRKDWRVANLRYGAFVRVTNLLNRRNCLQVFPTTGDCEGGSGMAGRFDVIGGGSIAETSTTADIWDRPDMVAAPRAINAGIRVTF